jgi:NAD(P)H-hydrate epimerase
LRELSLPEYSDEANKADYGKLLLVAGSRRLPGAAILAARAALRAGCGTVRLAAPESVATLIGLQVPELMVIPLPETKAGTVSLEACSILQEQWEPCDAVVVGPGLDENEETNVLLRRLAVEMPLPAVLDASALLALAGAKINFAFPRILTPHLQEACALLEQTEEKVEKDREGVALETAKAFNTVFALKGRETLVANEAGKVYKNTAGTRGLGTAGSGDVLAGIIGGLLAQLAAQKMDDATLRAAAWGVHLHALCGESGEKDMGDEGLIAGDLIGRLPGALRYLRKQTVPKKDGRFGLRPSS